VQLTDLPLREPVVRDLDDLLVEHGVHGGGAIVAPNLEGRGIGRAAGAAGRPPRRVEHPSSPMRNDFSRAAAWPGRSSFRHRVETRAPPVLVAVRDEVRDARLEVSGGAERAAAGDGDSVAHRVGDEPAPLRDEEVMLVGPQPERGERAPGLGPPDALHVLRRRFQPVAQHHRPQQQHQHVEPGHPSRDFQRGQEARGVASRGAVSAG
jgi:hypothetical protein